MRGFEGILQGAMTTSQCHRLLQAWQWAEARPTRVLVLSGARDYWSNGIHLNAIEAADSPGEASWENINAINDIVLALIRCTAKLVISALHGSAGAGGVILALPADHVIARQGILLNPHYRGMGGLYGSEYWTYLLPRRVGPGPAGWLTESLPTLDIAGALKLGLLDHIIPTEDNFDEKVWDKAQYLSEHPEYQHIIAQKTVLRSQDEAKKPLQAYRDQELQKMHENFFGKDPSYHAARHAFVHKLPAKQTPAHLARHRAAPTTDT